MAKYTNIGSVSSGTLVPQHLFPALLEELAKYDPARATSLQQLAFEELYSAWVRQDEMPTLSGLVDDVMMALDEHAPPYFYFGAHPGDGADFGFWHVEEPQQAIRDDGGIVVDDLSEVPSQFAGAVLHVGDHGNSSLYLADGKGGFEELWAVG